VTQFNTLGSTFDTLLAVYVGNSVNSLTVVASNDDIGYPPSHQSRVAFSAVATTQYHIAIDGYNGASGNTTLTWNPSGILLQVPPSTASSTSSSPKEVGGTNRGPTVSYRILGAGEYHLAITGQPLRRYNVEVSCDLAQWMPLATTLADSAGTAYFRDKSTMHTHRETADKTQAANSTETRFFDPICGIVRTNAAGLTETRFYRVIEVP